MKGPSPVFCAAVYVLVFSSLTVDLIAASSSASSDRFDCPAELPRVLVKSSLADTPAPGHVRLVKESDNLQKDEECKSLLQPSAPEPTVKTLARVWMQLRRQGKGSSK